MDELITWLSEQLNEDERVAADGIHMAYCVNDVRYPEECMCGWSARVLREVEAKRELLFQYEMEVQRGPARPAGLIAESEARHGGILDAYKAAIRIAASSYADRPGYQEEAWKL